MVRRAVGRGTEKLLDLLEIPAMWNREDFLGIAASRLVVRRRPGNCAFAGCAQSRRRSADECSGRAEGNWKWRCTKEVLSAAEFPALRELTKSATRTGIL